MGIVFVLLLGEIDLSVGYVSGVAGVLTALLLTPDGNELPTFVAVPRARRRRWRSACSTALSSPSSASRRSWSRWPACSRWNGVVLLLIGSRGTVILQNDFVIGLANNFMSDALAWILVVAVASRCTRPSSSRACAAAPRPAWPNEPIAARRACASASLFAMLAIVTAVANQDRGIPWVARDRRRLFLVFWTFVLNRTRFGRHIYAVGGNEEAARRAGINVDRDQDRLLRALLVHGGGRRHHPRLAPALGRHELGRRPDPALLDRRGGHRRHVAVRRPRAHEERAPRRARDRLDRQRARPARPVARARSSSSPAACCCSPSRSTRSRGRGAPQSGRA